MRDASHWLYESLPYIYVLAGLLAASVGDVNVTKLSATLLAAAGLIIFRLRMRYRATSAQRIQVRLAALR